MSLAPSFSPPRLLTEQSSWLTDSTGFKHQHIAPYHELHINNNTNNNQHHYHHYHLPPSTDRRRRVALHRQPSAGTTIAVASVHKESEPSVVHKDEESKKMMMKKTVRFCEQDKLEQVRLFLKSQKPSAVRHGDPSPSSYSQTIELKYPNWPPKTVIQSRSTVRMESVQVVTDNDQDTQTTAAAGEICLAGRCRVANLAFEKHVVVRYTTDYWKTYRETEAKYREPIGSSANTWDRFTFSICLNSSNDDGRPITVFLALRYTVNDREFWDNNDGLNYQIDVIPRPSEDDEEDEDENDDKPQFPGNRSKKEPAAMKPFTSTSGARRSMQDYTTQLKGKQQQQSSNKTDIASSLDNNIAPRRKKLSHRYDFGASLSAAKKVSFGKEDETDNVAVTFSVPTTAPARYRHPLLLVDSPSNKQSSHQDQDDDVGFQTRYHEFVNKYCFYGTTNYAPASTTPSLSPCASPEPIYG